MSSSETVVASIGIKILLSDLILQINETNLILIKEMLNNGFLEDENDYFNEVFKKICRDKLDGEYTDVKEYLIKQCKQNGSYIKSKYTNMLITDDAEYNLENGCIFDQVFLVPLKEILTTQRYICDNQGINSISRKMDFDLSINIDKYKEIKNIEIVFILHHITC